MITVIQNNAVSKWPKNVTGPHCKSELEVGELSDIWVNVESDDRVEITCQACGEQVILPDSSFTQAELKKARDFSNDDEEYSIHQPFGMESSACTLSPNVLSIFIDDWTVTGEVHEDYFEWINEFEATHPKYGWVRGDFEKTVYASSQKAYTEFTSHEEYHPKHWDYADI
jgi:hypothetical protein